MKTDQIRGGCYLEVFLTPREMSKLKQLAESLGKPGADVLRDYVRGAASHGGYDPRVHQQQKK